MSDYRPIACHIYERYELAIMHRQRLRVRWRDESGMPHLATLVPENLETREGEEFLIARDPGGERLRLRLDRILDARPVEPASPSI
ncbi:MAG TPA: transcriptional antiterminator, Rof [Gammaproteobacteria bacterium]|nr:transcriptional antiterminator, Rof [Gammaproteobacteria bacterium]